MPEVRAANCPVCGLAAPPGGRYCSNCATPLTEPVTAGSLLTVPSSPGAPRGGRRRAHRRPATSGWVKALIITLMVAVAAAVTVAVVLALGVGKASDNLNNSLKPQPGRPTGYQGPSYPGMLLQDHVAGAAGRAVDSQGETVTAGNLSAATSFLGPALCSPVTIANHAPTSKDVGPGEWKLLQPNGIIEGSWFTGTLPIVQIVPGGKASGTVCFADTGPPRGTYVLLWQPLFRVDRGVWLLPF